MFKNNVTLILFLVLVGCAVGPDYKRPEIASETDIAHSLGLVLVQKYQPLFSPKDFQDPVLDKLLERALQNAPDIRMALARVEQARAFRKSVVGTFFPSLDLSGKYQYENASQNVSLMLDEEAYQMGLSMAWEIDLFGRIRRQIEAEVAEEKEAEEALKATMVSLISEVTGTYVSLRTAERLLKETKADLEIQNSLYRLTKNKYDSGLANAIDVNQAAYQQSTTQASIPQLEERISGYENTLSLLLGELPDSLSKELQKTDRNFIEEDFHFNLNQLYELPVSVVRERPDVREAEAALIRENALLGASIAELFPKVSLAGLLGFESIHFSDLFHHQSYMYSYQPSVQMPLFHFGSLWQNMKAQESVVKEYQVSYEKALLTAIHEIKEALVSLNKEEKRYQSLKEAWQKIDKAARLARDRYESGLIDYFSVLDAEERRIAAQASLTSSAGALYQNIVRFYKSIGGRLAETESSTE